MKLKKRKIETVRIRPETAERLKEKCLEIGIESGVMIRESELVSFLIDVGIDRVEIENDSLRLP